MWESRQRFPSFPRPVPIARSSGGGRCYGLIPVLLELDRTDVVQRRVQSCSVIPEQPGDGFILGLPDSVKMLAVQPFYLQRTEQRLRARIVPAVALAAHRCCDAAFFKRRAVLLAGILTAAIAMENQLRVSVRATLEPSHLQSIDHQVPPHVRLQRPAHHSAAEQ